MSDSFNINVADLITIQNGVPVTDSRVVAEKFGKRHDHVLRDIRNLDCSEEFGRLNFGESEYLNSQGKSQPYYTMTRDGFTFLAMGFTGKKAAGWKEKYIAAFNAMEAELLAEKPALDPANLSRLQLIQLALDAESERLQLEAVVAEQAPKVRALDRISTADGSLCITDAAKHLQVRPKDLFAWLKQNVWIFRRHGKAAWLGYQHRVQQSLIEHKVTTVSQPDGPDKIKEQVRITPKGLRRLSLEFGSQQAAS